MNKKILIIVLCVLFTLNFSKYTSGSENSIIFKINDNVFTSLDLEKRYEYLDFVGNNNNNIDKKIIIDDFVSANLFYEYFKNLKTNDDYEIKINEIFENIYNTNNKLNKKYDYEINKKSILDNIRIDYIRKIVLENVFNSSFNSLKTSKEEIDLLYNIKIKYINLKTNKFNEIKYKINNLQNINFEKITTLLNKNEYEYFTKEKEINDINKIDKRVKKNILYNKNFFIIEEDNNTSLIFIEKKFETLEGVIANLYSLRSKIELNKENLKCENLSNSNTIQNLVQKEYKMMDLNRELKENLVNINDYVKFINNEEIVYIILCDLKFNKEILNNINFNKIFNLNVSKIENNFINKYSKIYNLIKFYE